MAGQPCPAWVHDRYTAAGPDGKQYPTWHPAIDPLYRCTFGHEHGDDPTGSPALGGRTIPFGYVGLSVGEVEAHPGFKVYRWDNVQHRNAPSHSGASLLIMFHQGSSNDNAFTQPFHEIHFHYVNHNDGREVHVQMLAPFGTLAIGCGANDPNMVSVRQANVPGTRQIPGPQCYGAARYPDTTGVIPGTIPYEDWITALYVGGDAQGNWRAYIDPHFSVFNPNRYCEPNPGLPAAAPCTLKRSDDRAGKGIDPASTDSWFKGVHREAYLNQVWLDNAGRSAVFWTDAHGMLVGSETPGAIRQYVASLDHRPLDNSAAFGADKEYDEDGTIHAPN